MSQAPWPIVFATMIIMGFTYSFNGGMCAGVFAILFAMSQAPWPIVFATMIIMGPLCSLIMYYVTLMKVPLMNNIIYYVAGGPRGYL